MLEQITNAKPLDYLSRGMQAASLRHEVESNNIANVNTPNFKRSDVSFEDALAKEMGLDGDEPPKLKLARTNPRHLPAVIGNGKAQPRILEDSTDSMRVDNNNVDIDREMAGLAKNQLYYNALATQAGNYITRMRNAITSGQG